METTKPVPYLAPAPKTAPECHRCGGPAVLKITQLSNPKGNAGRPYYKCQPCDLFLVFNDQRGNGIHNPPCYCDTSSKMQVSGLDKMVPRGLHYVCRLGRCDFYSAVLNRKDDQLSLKQDELFDLFMQFGMI